MAAMASDRKAVADADLVDDEDENDPVNGIPDIGEGARWYDRQYRVLAWLNRGRKRKLIPPPLRKRIADRINALGQYNELDHYRAESRDDPHRNMFVPADEHVRVPRLWVVELFPPAQLPALKAAMRRNGWDESSLLAANDEPNNVVLERSRAGNLELSWWRLADVTRTGNPYSLGEAFGAAPARLPDELRFATLRAVQVGPALTAVVAEFVVADEVSAQLDDVWHAPHEPELIVQDGHLRPLRRHHSGRRSTAQVRQGLHDSARRWMKTHVPGFFARHGKPHVLLEMVLFDKVDPSLTVRDYSERHARPQLPNSWVKMGNAMAALGIRYPAVFDIRSKALPKFLLASRREFYTVDFLRDEPTWTLWGNRAASFAALTSSQQRRGSGTVEGALAHATQRSFDYLVMLAVHEMLTVFEGRYADIRDSAGARHGRFTQQSLKSLRADLLELSLDLGSVEQDVAGYWKKLEVHGDEWHFTQKRSTWQKAADKILHRRTPVPNQTEDNGLRDLQRDQFTRLTGADREYRDILSTVASLGASADASRLGRWALAVALASLFVALVTVFVADVGCASILHVLLRQVGVETCSAGP